MPRNQTSKSTPIIVLTAMGDTTDRVVGLEMGADDYLPKPFDVRELEFRIRAVLRRTGLSAGTPSSDAEVGLTFAGWDLYLRRRRLLSPDGAIVDLTTNEFYLPRVFAQRPQRVLNRDELIDLVRGRGSSPFDRS